LLLCVQSRLVLLRTFVSGRCSCRGRTLNDAQTRLDTNQKHAQCEHTLTTGITSPMHGKTLWSRIMHVPDISVEEFRL